MNVSYKHTHTHTHTQKKKEQHLFKKEILCAIHLFFKEINAFIIGGMC